MGRVLECTNCGGGSSNLQFWVTVGALAIAGLALAMNFIQFREFLRQVRARAEFNLTLGVVGADRDGVLRPTGDAAAVRIALGIKNTGGRAAGETVINALVPDEAEDLRWSGPDGEALGDQDVSFTTAEKLGADGVEYDSKFIAMTLPRIGTKPHHLLHFQFDIELPELDEDLPEPIQLIVPIRVKVQADEIPNDIEDYIGDLDVRVERRANAQESEIT